MPSVRTDQPEKPVALKVAPEHIPLGLQIADCWVPWRYELVQNGRGESKWTKPPRQASGEYADATDRTTWTSFALAVVAYRSGRFDGIGRVFSADHPYTAIDLDHCRNPVTGAIEQWAVDLITLLRSYAETSPSGTGIRIVVRAKLPPGSRNRKGNIEIYDDRRYCTLTGHLLDGAVATVEPRQAEVEQFLVKVFGDAAKKTVHSNGNGNGRGATAAPSIDDAALLEKARAARNGDRFAALYDRGDYSGYSSQSEADLALCGMLGFWFAGDAASIDRLFRHSALMRDKWNRADYREDTLAKAVSGRTEYYDPLHGVRNGASPETHEADEQPTAEARESSSASLAGNELTEEPDPAGPYGDIALSHRLVRQHGADLRHAPDGWYRYDARRGLWEHDQKLKVFSLAKSMLAAVSHEIYADVVKYGKFPDKETAEAAARRATNGVSSARTVAAIVTLAQSHPAVAITVDQFDRDNWLLNTSGGVVVDLRDGTTRPARMRRLFHKDYSGRSARDAHTSVRYLHARDHGRAYLTRGLRVRCLPQEFGRARRRAPSRPRCRSSGAS